MVAEAGGRYRRRGGARTRYPRGTCSRNVPNMQRIPLKELLKFREDNTRESRAKTLRDGEYSITKIIFVVSILCVMRLMREGIVSRAS